jgi:hypothetical protein
MDPVSLFKKGIKHDPSIFPILKDEKQADDWKPSMMLNADAQDVANVLDPTYSPSTAAEQALFAKQQKYFMAILIIHCGLTRAKPLFINILLRVMLRKSLMTCASI